MTDHDSAGVAALYTGRLAEAFDPESGSLSYIKSITSTSVKVERLVSSSDVVVDVVLEVTPTGDNSLAWNKGENERWFHAKKVGDQWLIAEIDSSPF